MSGAGEGATVIHMDDGKGKAPVVAAAAAAGERGSSSSSYATAPTSSNGEQQGRRKTRSGGRGLPWLLRSGGGFRGCLGLMDLLLRLAALGPTLAAAITTGTADERLSVFTRFFKFHARFDDFPALTLLLVGNAVAAGYLVLSLPLSAAGVVKQAATGFIRPFLLVCDLVIMALLTAAGGAAAAVVYVAHSGNRRASWVPMCMQFHGFCQRTSGAVVASFLGVLIFVVLILMAACASKRRQGKGEDLNI